MSPVDLLSSKPPPYNASSNVCDALEPARKLTRRSSCRSVESSENSFERSAVMNASSRSDRLRRKVLERNAHLLNASDVAETPIAMMQKLCHMDGKPLVNMTVLSDNSQNVSTDVSVISPTQPKKVAVSFNSNQSIVNAFRRARSTRIGSSQTSDAALDNIQAKGFASDASSQSIIRSSQSSQDVEPLPLKRLRFNRLNLAKVEEQFKRGVKERKQASESKEPNRRSFGRDKNIKDKVENEHVETFIASDNEVSSSHDNADSESSINKTEQEKKKAKQSEILDESTDMNKDYVENRDELSDEIQDSSSDGRLNSDNDIDEDEVVNDSVASERSSEIEQVSSSRRSRGAMNKSSVVRTVATTDAGTADISTQVSSGKHSAAKDISKRVSVYTETSPFIPQQRPKSVLVDQTTETTPTLYQSSGISNKFEELKNKSSKLSDRSEVHDKNSNSLSDRNELRDNSRNQSSSSERLSDRDKMSETVENRSKVSTSKVSSFVGRSLSACKTGKRTETVENHEEASHNKNASKRVSSEEELVSDYELSARNGKGSIISVSASKTGRHRETIETQEEPSHKKNVYSRRSSEEENQVEDQESSVKSSESLSKKLSSKPKQVHSKSLCVDPFHNAEMESRKNSCSSLAGNSNSISDENLEGFRSKSNKNKQVPSILQDHAAKDNSKSSVSQSLHAVVMKDCIEDIERERNVRKSKLISHSMQAPYVDARNKSELKSKQISIRGSATEDKNRMHGSDRISSAVATNEATPSSIEDVNKSKLISGTAQPSESLYRPSKKCVGFNDSEWNASQFMPLMHSTKLYNKSSNDDDEDDVERSDSMSADAAAHGSEQASDDDEIPVSDKKKEFENVKRTFKPKNVAVESDENENDVAMKLRSNSGVQRSGSNVNILQNRSKASKASKVNITDNLMQSKIVDLHPLSAERNSSLSSHSPRNTNPSQAISSIFSVAVQSCHQDEPVNNSTQQPGFCSASVAQSSRQSLQSGGESSDKSANGGAVRRQRHSSNFVAPVDDDIEAGSEDMSSALSADCLPLTPHVPSKYPTPRSVTINKRKHRFPEAEQNEMRHAAAAAPKSKVVPATDNNNAADNKKKSKSKKPARIPSKLTKQIFEMFAGMRISKDGLEELESIADEFWKRSCDDVEKIAQKAGRRTVVDRQDVETLMEREGYITEQESIDILIEKYLPMEYREELIPVARSGNRLEKTKRRR